MKSIFTSLGVALVGAAVLGGCQMANGGLSGGEVRWSGEPFDRIAATGPDRIEISIGDRHAVDATGDPDVVERLRYKVVDGELRIGRESGWSLNDDGSATVRVTAPVVHGVKLAGSGDVSVERMEGDSVSASIAGSGDLDIGAMVATTLNASIAGSGSIKVAGQADTTKLSIAGSGDFSGGGLNSETATIKIAGSGDARLRSDGRVDAKIVGSGDVRIDGKAECTSKAVGSGTLVCG